MIRRGMTLLEALVAGVLLAAMMTICLQLFAAVAAERRAMENRQTAAQDAANLMERLIARPWNELTPSARRGKAEGGRGNSAFRLQPSAFGLPPSCRSLPGGSVEIELITAAGQPEAKRITVSVHWQDRSGPAAPVRLVAWRYR